jgi:hypothetical protein
MNKHASSPIVIESAEGDTLLNNDAVEVIVTMQAGSKTLPWPRWTAPKTTR